MIICQRLFHIWRSIGNGTDENRVKMKFTQDLVTHTQDIVTRTVKNMCQKN